MADNVFDIAIVGGGIVGAATFYKLQQSFPALKIILIEKEKQLASHQTGNNSGVIHSGLYYKPGSLKAKNCVVGRHELVKFAKEHNVDHDVCGKVVVATKESEFKFMDQIFENGIANKTEGIEKISADQVKEIEPFVEAKAGIWVPCTGIVDFVTTIFLESIYSPILFDTEKTYSKFELPSFFVGVPTAINIISAQVIDSLISVVKLILFLTY